MCKAKQNKKVLLHEYTLKKYLKKYFPQIKINKEGRVFLHPLDDVGFLFADCVYLSDLKHAIIEDYVKFTCAFAPYPTLDDNFQMQCFAQHALNRFLGTSFKRNEFNIINDTIGEGKNYNLAKKFVDSGFDIEVLQSSSKSER